MENGLSHAIPSKRFLSKYLIICSTSSMMECWNHEPVWIQTQKYIAFSSEVLVLRFLQIVDKYLFIRLVMFDTTIALRTRFKLLDVESFGQSFSIQFHRWLYFFFKPPFGQSEPIYWTLLLLVLTKELDIYKIKYTHIK